MQLKLERPLAFFDLETTGTNIATDRIVEISILRVMPDGQKKTWTQRINPECPISAEVTAIHGISNEDVKDAPTFSNMAGKIFKLIFDADLAGFNSNRFDVPILVEEFLRADIQFDPSEKRLIDVQTIFHKKEQRNLSAAYKFYCQKELTDAHSAEADALATYEVLKSQLDRYPDLPNDMDHLHEFSQYQTRLVDFAGRIAYNKDDVEVFNFGKFKGQPVEKVLKENPGYFGWFINGDFPLYTKKILRNIFERTKSKP